MTDTNSVETFEKFASVYVSTLQLVHDSAEAQYQVGKTPVPAQDTSERSKGMTSDPTFAAVSDGRRIKLRESVLQAEKALADARTNLAIAFNLLNNARRTG